MSVSWKKLKVGPKQLTPAEIVAYIAEPQPSGDYYSEAGQALMMWHVTERAAVVLGIASAGERASRQEVRRKTLCQLISGRNPRTGEQIRKSGPDGTSVGAIDLTVSPAPKSVSVLWALGSRQLRYELEAMVALAADRAVMRMLEEQPLVRQRFAPSPHGVRHVSAEDFVAASALHTTARIANGRGVADPQLHLHYLLIGALDTNDQLRALDSRVLANYQAELEAEATGHLAELLRQRGFEIERRLEQRRNGQPRVAWEVRGVPESLIKAMSSRTTEIADLKKKFMAEYGREPEGPAWEAWIVKQRGPKAKLTAAGLRLEWMREAGEHDFGTDAVGELVDAADHRRAAGIPEIDIQSPQTQEFRDLLLQHVCREYAFVPESYLDRVAYQLAVGLIPASVVDWVIARMMADNDLLVTKDDGMITTLQILAWEQRSLRAVRQLLSSPPAPGVADGLVKAELARRAAEGQPFDKHQATAVRVAVSGARFVSIAGPAGTGKGVASAAITELFRTAVSTLLHSGQRRVIAVAVAGRTAQQAGADSGADLALTLDDLNYRLSSGRLQLGPEDVLVVDEASMIDHSRYTAVLEAAASSSTTVIQIGDDRQLAPVGPGGLWTSAHRLAETAGTAAELCIVRRALEEREARAWKAIREGRVAEGLTTIRDQGRLRLYETREQLRAGMVDAWWEAGPDRGLMIVDTSNEERDQVNRLAQERRLQAGELGKEAIRLDEHRELRVGDRVLFSAIYRPQLAGAEGKRWVKRIENGTAAVVQAVDVERGKVDLELDEPTGRRVLRVGSAAPIELGYARHVYKAQGVTRDTVDLALSLRTHLNELYVMTTRARQGARIHALAAELEEPAAERAEPLDVDFDARRSVKAEEVEPTDQINPAQETAPQQHRHYRQQVAAGRPAAEMLAEIERARSRRQELEGLTIREIARRAKPSTKEALGERPMELGTVSAHERMRRAASRAQHRAAYDVERQDRTVCRWSRCPSLDREVPNRSSRAAELASKGYVDQPRSADLPPPKALPARDLAEDAARGYIERIDTVQALALYEFAGRLEYSADPIARAVERLATDSEAVLVLNKGQAERAWTELQKQPELAADVKKRCRIRDQEQAYQERVQRREVWQAAHTAPARTPRVEPSAIRRGYVVADEPWASPELTKAVSVAADSHLITTQPRPFIAEAVQAEAERLRIARAQLLAERRAEQAERVRTAAHERSLQADRAPTRSAEHKAGRREVGGEGH